MVDYFYSRLHLAKVTRPNEHGWRELRLTEDYIDLAEALNETLGRIRDRDGTRFPTRPRASWSIRSNVIGRRDSSNAVAA
jgi:hypothetical protein